MSFKITKHSQSYFGESIDWFEVYRQMNQPKELAGLRPDVEKNKFATIDEKMADIKARIGFDKIKEMLDARDALTATATASKESCGCGGDCCSAKKATAEYKFPEHVIESMDSIIDYAKQYILANNDKTLSANVVISHMREIPDLKFDVTPINIAKFSEYLEKVINKTSKVKNNNVKYIREDEKDAASTNSSDINELYQHASPESKLF